MVVAMLLDLRWEPLSPTHWRSNKGEDWQSESGFPLDELWVEIREQLEKQVWARAAKHHAGKGLECGCDLT